jgi:hypothetical protein
MNKITYNLIIVLVLIVKIAIGQNEQPPSLTLGINGLSYNRGVLDPEIIAEIIADKQDELKKEFVQRYILKQLEGHSYALWEFFIKYKRQKNYTKVIIRTIGKSCHGLCIL